MSTVILSTPEYWQTSFPQNWDKNTKHKLNYEDVSALSRVLTTLFIFNIHLLMIPWELGIIEFSQDQDQDQFLLLLFSKMEANLEWLRDLPRDCWGIQYWSVTKKSRTFPQFTSISNWKVVIWTDDPTRKLSVSRQIASHEQFLCSFG